MCCNKKRFHLLPPFAGSFDQCEIKFQWQFLHNDISVYQSIGVFSAVCVMLCICWDVTVKVQWFNDRNVDGSFVGFRSAKDHSPDMVWICIMVSEYENEVNSKLQKHGSQISGPIDFEVLTSRISMICLCWSSTFLHGSYPHEIIIWAVTKQPGCVFNKGDYTTQLYGDCN